MKTKYFARILAACLTASAMCAAPLSVQAAQLADTSTYIQSIHPERFAMTAEEAASGTVAIPTAVYLKGSTSSKMIASSVQCQLTADASGQLYFSDIYNPSNVYEETEYSCLAGTFTTTSRPFCFGTLNDGTYKINAIASETRDYCVNPKTGSYIFYNGNDSIRFMMDAHLYVTDDGVIAPDNQKHEVVCPLTINDDGSASYTFRYADRYYVAGQTEMAAEIAEATGIIPYYQPELLAEGDKISSQNDLLFWSNGLNANSFFLGNSDDFPLMETSTRFKAGTPCGLYSIAFDEEYTNTAVSIDGKTRTLPVKFETAAIIVGAKTASESTITAPKYACYYAEDTKVITANSMGANYVCDVTFTDGTAQTLDVTGAVNAAISPAQLFDSAKSEGCFIGPVSMLCGDTSIGSAAGAVPQTVQEILVGKKGDANMDGDISVSDATITLTYFAKVGAGLDAAFIEGGTEAQETLAYFLADINTQSQTMTEGGTIDVSDASAILSYFSAQGAGLALSWDDFI